MSNTDCFRFSDYFKHETTEFIHIHKPAFTGSGHGPMGRLSDHPLMPSSKGGPGEVARQCS